MTVAAGALVPLLPSNASFNATNGCFSISLVDRAGAGASRIATGSTVRFSVFRGLRTPVAESASNRAGQKLDYLDSQGLSVVEPAAVVQRADQETAVILQLRLTVSPSADSSEAFYTLEVQEGILAALVLATDSDISGKILPGTTTIMSVSSTITPQQPGSPVFVKRVVVECRIATASGAAATLLASDLAPLHGHTGSKSTDLTSRLNSVLSGQLISFVDLAGVPQSTSTTFTTTISGGVLRSTTRLTRTNAVAGAVTNMTLVVQATTQLEVGQIIFLHLPGFTSNATSKLTMGTGFSVEAASLVSSSTPVNAAWNLTLEQYQIDIAMQVPAEHFAVISFGAHAQVTNPRTTTRSTIPATVQVRDSDAATVRCDAVVVSLSPTIGSFLSATVTGQITTAGLGTGVLTVTMSSSTPLMQNDTIVVKLPGFSLAAEANPANFTLEQTVSSPFLQGASWNESSEELSIAMNQTAGSPLPNNTAVVVKVSSGMLLNPSTPSSGLEGASIKSIDSTGSITVASFAVSGIVITGGSIVELTAVLSDGASDAEATITLTAQLNIMLAGPRRLRVETPLFKLASSGVSGLSVSSDNMLTMTMPAPSSGLVAGSVVSLIELKASSPPVEAGLVLNITITGLTNPAQTMRDAGIGMYIHDTASDQAISAVARPRVPPAILGEFGAPGLTISAPDDGTTMPGVPTRLVVKFPSSLPLRTGDHVKVTLTGFSGTSFEGKLVNVVGGPAGLTGLASYVALSAAVSLLDVVLQLPAGTIQIAASTELTFSIGEGIRVPTALGSITASASITTSTSATLVPPTSPTATFAVNGGTFAATSLVLSAATGSAGSGVGPISVSFRASNELIGGTHAIHIVLPGFRSTSESISLTSRTVNENVAQGAELLPLGGAFRASTSEFIVNVTTGSSFSKIFDNFLVQFTMGGIVHPRQPARASQGSIRIASVSSGATVTAMSAFPQTIRTTGEIYDDSVSVADLRGGYPNDDSQINAITMSFRSTAALQADDTIRVRFRRYSLDPRQQALATPSFSLTFSQVLALSLPPTASWDASDNTMVIPLSGAIAASQVITLSFSGLTNPSLPTLSPDVQMAILDATNTSIVTGPHQIARVSPVTSGVFYDDQVTLTNADPGETSGASLRLRATSALAANDELHLSFSGFVAVPASAVTLSVTGPNVSSGVISSIALWDSLTSTVKVQTKKPIDANGLLVDLLLSTMRVPNSPGATPTVVVTGKSPFGSEKVTEKRISQVTTIPSEVDAISIGVETSTAGVGCGIMTISFGTTVPVPTGSTVVVKLPGYTAVATAATTIALQATQTVCRAGTTICSTSETVLQNSADWDAAKSTMTFTTTADISAFFSVLVTVPTDKLLNPCSPGRVDATGVIKASSGSRISTRNSFTTTPVVTGGCFIEDSVRLLPGIEGSAEPFYLSFKSSVILPSSSVLRIRMPGFSLAGTAGTEKVYFSINGQTTHSTTAAVLNTTMTTDPVLTVVLPGGADIPANTKVAVTVFGLKNPSAADRSLRLQIRALKPGGQDLTLCLEGETECAATPVARICADATSGESTCTQALIPRSLAPDTLVVRGTFNTSLTAFNLSKQIALSPDSTFEFSSISSTNSLEIGDVINVMMPGFSASSTFASFTHQVIVDGAATSASSVEFVRSKCVLHEYTTTSPNFWEKGYDVNVTTDSAHSSLRSTCAAVVALTLPVAITKNTMFSVALGGLTLPATAPDVATAYFAAFVSMANDAGVVTDFVRFYDPQVQVSGGSVVVGSDSFNVSETAVGTATEVSIAFTPSMDIAPGSSTLVVHLPGFGILDGRQHLAISNATAGIYLNSTADWNPATQEVRVKVIDKVPGNRAPLSFQISGLRNPSDVAAELRGAVTVETTEAQQFLLLQHSVATRRPLSLTTSFLPHPSTFNVTTMDAQSPTVVNLIVNASTLLPSGTLIDIHIPGFSLDTAVSVLHKPETSGTWTNTSVQLLGQASDASTAAIRVPLAADLPALKTWSASIHGLRSPAAPTKVTPLVGASQADGTGGYRVNVRPQRFQTAVLPASGILQRAEMSLSSLRAGRRAVITLSLVLTIDATPGNILVIKLPSFSAASGAIPIESVFIGGAIGTATGPVLSAAALWSNAGKEASISFTGALPAFSYLNFTLGNATLSASGVSNPATARVVSVPTVRLLSSDRTRQICKESGVVPATLVAAGSLSGPKVSWPTRLAGALTGAISVSFRNMFKMLSGDSVCIEFQTGFSYDGSTLNVEGPSVSNSDGSEIPTTATWYSSSLRLCTQLRGDIVTRSLVSFTIRGGVRNPSANTPSPSILMFVMNSAQNVIGERTAISTKPSKVYSVGLTLQLGGLTVENFDETQAEAVKVVYADELDISPESIVITDVRSAVVDTQFATRRRMTNSWSTSDDSDLVQVEVKSSGHQDTSGGPKQRRRLETPGPALQITMEIQQPSLIAVRQVRAKIYDDPPGCCAATNKFQSIDAATDTGFSIFNKLQDELAARTGQVITLTGLEVCVLKPTRTAACVYSGRMERQAVRVLLLWCAVTACREHPNVIDHTPCLLLSAVDYDPNLCYCFSFLSTYVFAATQSSYDNTELKTQFPSTIITTINEGISVLGSFSNEQVQLTKVAAGGLSGDIVVSFRPSVVITPGDSLVVQFDGFSMFNPVLRVSTEDSTLYGLFESSGTWDNVLKRASVTLSKSSAPVQPYQQVQVILNQVRQAVHGVVKQLCAGFFLGNQYFSSLSRRSTAN